MRMVSIFIVCIFTFSANLAEAQRPGTRAIATQPTTNRAAGAKSILIGVKPFTGAVQEYRTANFKVFTDLPEAEARDLMNRLEVMLTLISRYWGMPNRKTIECYVVKNLKNWPNGVLDPRGIQSIQAGGGVTLSRVTSRNGVPINADAKVYAIADRGTPQHEAVHAYCAQTFGRTGPTWYSEGMAEMGQYWVKDDLSVNCHPVVEQYLKRSKPKAIDEIIGVDDVGGWQDYAWRWALCHLLENNSNYRARFRPLGIGLLQNKPVSFVATYGASAKEINFEYQLFLQNFSRGYRVDLCSWDWKTRFIRPRSATSHVVSKIDAKKGWQASRLLVKKDEAFSIKTSGVWKVQPEGEMLDATGQEDGKGKLIGIIFNNYRISDPFLVSPEETFVAPHDGKLFLRCQDHWHEIADNVGSVTVQIKTAPKDAG